MSRRFFNVALELQTGENRSLKIIIPTVSFSTCHLLRVFEEETRFLKQDSLPHLLTKIYPVHDINYDNYD